ncbi:MAG: radical SAM protein [Clostridia bacterium]|nr:radical SAM protein [Clostridia bacterium]
MQEKLKELEKCEICPHQCKSNRNKGKIGRCKATDKVKIALYSVHHFEEPCISGEKGSGTIFFSNCNLNCIYCQNYEISQLGRGKEITIEELAEIFLKQQEKGVENINLVTPTSYVMQIIEAIKTARKKGLTIPIVYNTNAYENVETLKLLEGYIDVYLPDLKYAENELDKKYSKIDNYFEIATRAIQEMVRQVGVPKLNEKGIVEKGVMIRHLVLPNQIENSKSILRWITKNLPNEIYVSIMAQYFPTYKAKEDEKLNRKLTKKEWQEIEDYIEELEIENGYVQELGEQEEEYVPNWW